MYRQRVGDYSIGKTIGEGSFAKVKYGQNVETGETVAIKVLDKDMVEKAKIAPQIKKEIAIMRRLRHPHVVDLRHVMATKSHIYLVLELITGGELFERVAGGGPLPEAQARTWFQQLVDGLAHCHSRGVYHRDLKLENILLTADNVVKLSDFGLGAVREAAAEKRLLHTVCGTPNYAAPEVLQQSAYEGASADIWSLGVCLYVMLAGCLPFDERSVGALLKKILAAEYETPPWLSKDAASLLRSMLTADPAKRTTLDAIKQHPWFLPGYKPAASLATPAAPIADDPANEFTFNDPAQLQTMREALSPTKATVKKKQLNAFELLGSAMDISSLFDKQPQGSAPLVRRATRFTSRVAPAEIARTIEHAAMGLGCECSITDFEGMPNLRLSTAAGRGSLTVLVEVGELVPGLRLVEFHRAHGDSIDFFQLYGALLPQVSAIVARSTSGSGEPLSPSKVASLSDALSDASLASPSATSSRPALCPRDANGTPAPGTSPAATAYQQPPAVGAATPASVPTSPANARSPAASQPLSPLPAPASQPASPTVATNVQLNGLSRASPFSEPQAQSSATAAQPEHRAGGSGGRHGSLEATEGKERSPTSVLSRLRRAASGGSRTSAKPPPAPSTGHAIGAATTDVFDGGGDQLPVLAGLAEGQPLSQPLAVTTGGVDIPTEAGDAEPAVQRHSSDQMEWQPSREVLARLSGQLSSGIGL